MAGTLFLPEFPQGSPAHHWLWLQLLMTVTSFVYWYGRQYSIYQLCSLESLLFFSFNYSFNLSYIKTPSRNVTPLFLFLHDFLHDFFHSLHSFYQYLLTIYLCQALHWVLKITWWGTSLVVQWLGLGTFTDMAWVQSLVGELRSTAARCGQKKKDNMVNKKTKSLSSRIL